MHRNWRLHFRNPCSGNCLRIFDVFNLITVQQDATYSVYYISVGSCLQKYNKLNKSHLVGQLLTVHGPMYKRKIDVLKFKIWDGAPWRRRRRMPKRVGVLVQHCHLIYERWIIKCWFNEGKVYIIENCWKKIFYLTL